MTSQSTSANSAFRLSQLWSAQRRMAMSSIVVGCLLAGVLPCCAVDALAQPAALDRKLSLEELRAARDEAKHRQRRIIVNNDGNDSFEAPYTPERFLESRTAGLADTHVDTVFYCSGIPMLYAHRSKIAERMGVGKHQDVPGKEWVGPLDELGTDSLEIVSDWCRRNNREVFWSMRMNDRHDSSNQWTYLITDWKREHPELLMGTQEDGLPAHFERGKGSWSFMRYDRPEVRDIVFRLFEEVCNNYDVDGIELDFWRHPAFFIEPLEGKPVPQDKMDEMTELVRRIRRMTEEVGIRKGKPILVAIRIPDSLDYCRAMGLDVGRWLDEDLVDLATGADYFKLEPWEEFARMGEKYDIPVYACFEARRLRGSKDVDVEVDIQVWRGEAYNAWKAGIDGIYLMNRFDPHDPMLNELGDPKLLETLPRTDQTSYYHPDATFKPQDFVPDGLKYLKRPSDEDP
jgi:hypothetical protein